MQFDQLRRREFMSLLGGAAAWPIAARAQQRGGKLATVGVMASGTVADTRHLTAAFVQRLRELGWIEGRNVAIEYRWGEGSTERFTEIADEFVRLKVDLILTHNTPPVLAAKRATSVIPIVFATHCCKSVPTGWQYHRLVGPGIRHDWEADRTVA